MPSLCPAMALEVAVQRGLPTHPAVRAAAAEVAEAGTEAKMARSGYLPSLSLSAGPKAADFGEVVYDATLSQPVYDWGRTSSRVSQADNTRERAAQALRQAREEASLDIAETYLDTLVAQRRVAAVQSHLERLQEIDGMTASRSQGGYADRSEHERTRLELARGQEQLALEEGSLREATSAFVILVGEEPHDLLEPAPQPLQQTLAGQPMERAIEQAPLLRQAGADVGVAEGQLREARASLKPQVNLEASALRRDIGGRLEDDQTISLRLRMDVLEGLSNFQRPTAARQRVEAAQWNLDATRRDLRRQTASLVASAESLQAREAALSQQVDDAAEVADLYRVQFEVGRRDVLDLLNVQRERLDAERQFISLHLERLRTGYRIAAQLGLLADTLEGGRNGG